MSKGCGLLMYNPFSLEGKRILVTGASSGIGKASAVECSKMGASIIACGRNEKRLESTMQKLDGGGHIPFIGDLSNPETITALVDSIPAIDGALFAAGQVLVYPMLFSNSDKFKSLFETNFFANVEILRLLVKKKKVNVGGSLVYIVSIGGTRDFVPGATIYGTSKAALNSFVRYSAIELAPKKIRVNGILPGCVNTPMVHEGNVSDEQLKKSIEDIPLKRYGEPEEIAKAAVYLLSEASSWVTGSSLVIDGGMSAK